MLHHVYTAFFMYSTNVAYLPHNDFHVGYLCLTLQIEKKGNTSCLDVRKQLLDMRRYRHGLIQTWQQLRFSYCAILEGSKVILRGDDLGSLTVEVRLRLRVIFLAK